MKQDHPTGKLQPTCIDVAPRQERDFPRWAGLLRAHGNAFEVHDKQQIKTAALMFWVGTHKQEGIVAEAPGSLGRERDKHGGSRRLQRDL